MVVSKSYGPPILVDRGRTDNGQTGLPAKSQSADGACLAGAALCCRQQSSALLCCALFDSRPPLSRAPSVCLWPPVTRCLCPLAR